ncbi:MAG: hypothetical protein DSZ12_03650, partial [Sulfurovum sp.]
WGYGGEWKGGDGDWTSSKNRTLNWSATDGRSVCPVGFRVPTAEELAAEIHDDPLSKDFLEFPTGGYRYADAIGGKTNAYIWTNSVGGTCGYRDSEKPSTNTGIKSLDSSLPHDSDYINCGFNRDVGFNVRCIKD